MRYLNPICIVFLLIQLACSGRTAEAPTEAVEPSTATNPQNLRVEKIGDGEVWLTWEGTAGLDVDFYVVYRATSAEPVVAADSTFQTTFRDQGLNYETEYTYYVTAVTRSGLESERSNSVSGQPFNSLSPIAPDGFRAVAHNITILGQLEILLDWNESPETDIEGYLVYRSTNPDFITDPSTQLSVVSVPRFVDTDIEVGVLYHYRVTALDRGSKESQPSSVAADVALPEPVLMNPVAGELTSSTPTFQWNVVPDALQYRVIVTTSPTSGEIAQTEPTAGTSAGYPGQQTQLESGNIYYWKVVASTKEDGAENSVSAVERFKVR